MQMQTGLRNGGGSLNFISSYRGGKPDRAQNALSEFEILDAATRGVEIDHTLFGLNQVANNANPFANAQNLYPAQPATQIAPKRKATQGFLDKLKGNLIEMFFEEVPADRERPIGITQLTKKTFSVSRTAEGSTFYKNSGQRMGNYSFAQLTEAQNLYD